MSMTSVIRYVRALDTSSTTGAGKTGLAFGDITAKYLIKGGTLVTLTTQNVTTLGTYEAPTLDTNIRIKELSNVAPCQGVYEVHFHNTQVAEAGVKLWLFLSATGAAFVPYEMSLIEQTGDAYAIVSNVSYGNSALRDGVSEIDAHIGTPAVTLAADIAAIEAQTDDIGTAGAGLTAIPWNASWDAEVQSEVTDALAASSIPLTVVSPLAVNSNLTLIRGDDYYNADGRAITFTFTSAPDITGATARFKWTVDGALVGTTSGIAGTVTSSTTCYFEFNSTHTTQTPTHTGNVQTSTIYRYDAEFTLTNGHVCTLARGELYLLADQRV